MEVHQKADAFIEKDGDLEYDHTKIILKGPGDQYFAARVRDRRLDLASINLDQLEKTSIPTDDIWPLFPGQLSRAPDPLPSNCYVKEPCLLNYGDTPASLQLGRQLLQEAEMCEVLMKHPHPNVATYFGCIVRDNRIRGLCFAEYTMTLSQRLRTTDTPLDRDLCLDGIERGIRHMRSLGLVHNDINPANVMLDASGRPIVIDFDSCRRQGEELGVKAGTLGWEIKGERFARFDNDLYGLAKVRDHVHAH